MCSGSDSEGSTQDVRRSALCILRVFVVRGKRCVRQRSESGSAGELSSERFTLLYKATGDVCSVL